MPVGGSLHSSDHSIYGEVDWQCCQLVMNCIREYGRYGHD